jgi:hypothetical protein
MKLFQLVAVRGAGARKGEVRFLLFRKVLAVCAVANGEVWERS